MTRMSIRDVSLNGGRRARLPVGTDARWAFGRSGHCGRSELVRISSLSSSYDHRCNGRSVGAAVSSMRWENLTADADVLRERLVRTLGGARPLVRRACSS
jgi:hypothetical protein